MASVYSFTTPTKLVRSLVKLCQADRYNPLGPDRNTQRGRDVMRIGFGLLILVIWTLSLQRNAGAGTPRTADLEPLPDLPLLKPTWEPYHRRGVSDRSRPLRMTGTRRSKYLAALAV